MTAVHTRRSDALPVPGVLPPGFEFKSMIGSGGGGWVSLAHQTSLDRLVAVKTVLVGDLATPSMQRLEREGRVLARLNHPGIVRVHQLIEYQQALYLVMEHLHGVGLDRAITTGLPPADTLSILSDLAAALTPVHHLQIAHRDIKPANIMLHPRRGAVLLDFGLARLPLARSTFRTEAGIAAGTPHYMAPEQIDQPDLATPAIDAYAFGVLSYQLLLGERPYQTGPSLAQILEGHRHADPTDPRTIAPTLRPGTAAAMLRALSKDPQRRPTPAELVDELTKTHPRDWPGLAAQPSQPAATSAPTGISITGHPHHADKQLPADQQPTTPWVPPNIYHPPQPHHRIALLLVICLAALAAGAIAGAILLHR